MPLVDVLCCDAAGLELSLGVLLEPCVFLLESTLNAFSAFLLTDSNGSFPAQLWCAVESGPDFPGEIYRIHYIKSIDSG
jgi:hypothetical protein